MYILNHDWLDEISDCFLNKMVFLEQIYTFIWLTGRLHLRIKYFLVKILI